MGLTPSKFHRGGVFEIKYQHKNNMIISVIVCVLVEPLFIDVCGAIVKKT